MSARSLSTGQRAPQWSFDLGDAVTVDGAVAVYSGATSSMGFTATPIAAKAQAVQEITFTAVGAGDVSFGAVNAAVTTVAMANGNTLVTFNIPAATSAAVNGTALTSITAILQDAYLPFTNPTAGGLTYVDDTANVFPMGITITGAAATTGRIVLTPPVTTTPANTKVLVTSPMCFSYVAKTL